MVKIFSFYLPQYHPIKENDEWWGEGFTEWRNVVKSSPKFRGHYQPHIPAELGFYDLRVPETRVKQAQLAREYGVDGFIYYHYWFSGKRLLNRPLDEVLSTKEPNFPFAVCWANESWSRAWDGLEHQILIKQEYSLQDNEAHARHLLEIFRDQRYIKIGNRPLFLIYRAERHPFLEDFVNCLNKMCSENNLGDIFLLAVASDQFNKNNPNLNIIDGVVDFQPNSAEFPLGASVSMVKFAKYFLPSKLYQYFKLNFSFDKVVNYQRLVEEKLLQYKTSEFKYFPCCFTSWDNSARRRTPTIIQNNDAKNFKKWLQACCEVSSSKHPHHPIVFVNAWNEWAEGCHLEPDIRNGKRFLHAVRQVKDRLT